MYEYHLDSRGRMYCKPHRREVCHICCVDHRMTNEIVLAGEGADVEAISQWNEALQTVEHSAMLEQHRLEGNQGPLTLGGEESQRLFDAVASKPGGHKCEHCGLQSDKLLLCGRCNAVRYCSKECQVSHYPQHKTDCRNSVPNSVNSEKLVSWKQLEAKEVVPGKTLKVRIVSRPIAVGRYAFYGKDHKGDVNLVAFYLDSEDDHKSVLQSLVLGKVLNWTSPRFRYFLDGRKGARIEDDDMPNITITDS